MPTYEYKCDSCKIEFERFQKMSDEALKVCPECGGEVRRLISTGGGLVFKGPGFYATDYRSGTSGASGSQSPSPGNSESTKSAGSEGKSATGRGDANAGE